MNFGGYFKSLKNLKDFQLNLSNNKLGDNEQDIKKIIEILKYISNNLQSLSLNLEKNNLGSK